jgi:hypothetical protein
VTGKMKCLEFPTQSFFMDVKKKFIIVIISEIGNVWIARHVGISNTGRKNLL